MHGRRGDCIQTFVSCRAAFRGQRQGTKAHPGGAQVAPEDNTRCTAHVGVRVRVGRGRGAGAGASTCADAGAGAEAGADVGAHAGLRQQRVVTGVGVRLRRAWTTAKCANHSELGTHRQAN
eukprot:5391157-Pleurochrysis_carterae.AAC.1